MPQKIPTGSRYGIDPCKPEQTLTSQVGLILQQLRGLFSGYNAYSTREEKVDLTTMLLYQLNYELGDIQEGSVDDPSQRSPLLAQKRMEDSHCSVLVRLSEDGQHLYASHGR